MIDSFTYRVEYGWLVAFALPYVTNILILLHGYQSAIPAPYIPTVVLRYNCCHMMKGLNRICFTSTGFLSAFDDSPDGFLHNIFSDILLLTSPGGDTIRVDKRPGKRAKCVDKLLPCDLALEI